eukprot:2850883-Prymnesium_polylepis.1
MALRRWCARAAPRFDGSVRRAGGACGCAADKDAHSLRRCAVAWSWGRRQVRRPAGARASCHM